MESQYAHYFDLNGLLEIGCVGWFFVFVVRSWKATNKPLIRLLWWTGYIAVLSLLDRAAVRLLPMSLSHVIDQFVHSFTALPFAILIWMLIRRVWRTGRNLAETAVRLVIVPLLWAAFGVAALYGGLAWIPVGGFGYNVGNPRDAGRLRVMASEAQPLIEALDRYEKEQGRFPETTNDLNPKYLDPKYFKVESGWSGQSVFGNSAGMAIFNFVFRDEHRYFIYRKLNWDAGLRYDHQINRRNCWYYDTGDEPAQIPVPMPRPAR